MSFNPPRQAIEPFWLFEEAISQVPPIYVPLLIVSSPRLLITITQNFLPEDTASAISFIYLLTIDPIITGTAVYFIYRYLKHETIDLSGAFKNAISHSGQIILGTFLYFIAIIVGFFLLIVPGLHLSVRWGFVPCAIILDNCTALDSFKFSSNLVKGRWWQVFDSMLIIAIMIIPVLRIAAILGVTSGILELVGLLITPPLVLYYVKLYLRLKETANLDQDF